MNLKISRKRYRKNQYRILRLHRLLKLLRLCKVLRVLKVLRGLECTKERTAVTLREICDDFFCVKVSQVPQVAQVSQVPQVAQVSQVPRMR